MHSLKGGSEWSNNGKTIIVVHREFASNITQINIQKAKPKIVGKQGNTVLQYDVKEGKFFETELKIGFSEPVRNYASKSQETNQINNYNEPREKYESPF